MRMRDSGIGCELGMGDGHADGRMPAADTPAAVPRRMATRIMGNPIQ